MLTEQMGIDAMALGRETCYGHFGFWGVASAYCPRSRVALTGMINQADGFATPMAELLQATHRLIAPRADGDAAEAA
jgi:hypothetical protein